MSRELFVWSEKYRPLTVDECILPERIKDTFRGFVKQGELPNMMLVGPPGCGKTTIAMAALHELGCNFMVIPASLRGDMDTLRNEITNFATSVSFTGGRKYILLDEADYLSWRTQPALRNFIQDYSSNCGFILTANYANKIIKELHSRCPPFEFVIDKKDRPGLASQFLKRVKDILRAEKVKYDEKAVVSVIIKYFPDFRRVLDELQRHSANGVIDESILNDLQSVSIKELIEIMKVKDFTKVRKWVAENLTNDTQVIFREFYNEANSYFEPAYIPELVLTIAKYQYQAMFSTDAEINLAAFLVEVMVSAVWKK